MLEKISGQVATIEERIATVATGASEQLGGIQTVNSTVNEMDQRIQQNAAMAEETTAATTRLVDEINQLTQMVQSFRISEHQAAAPSMSASVAPPVLAPTPKTPQETQTSQLKNMATTMKSTSQAKPAAAQQEWDDNDKA